MLLSIKRFFIRKKDEKRNKHLIVLSLKIGQNKQQYHFRKEILFMTEYLLSQLEFLLRLLIAAICGGIIGYERKNRLKEAGVRTHLIVCLAAALMMIISKYGFYDILGLNGFGLDPSRIAAQIVSGVGFLGAGMIFMKRQEISGLTTAAGIWATAGVGMAIGAGLYLLGITAAVIIIIVQILLHKNFNWIKAPAAELIHIQLENSDDAIDGVRASLEKNQIEILHFKAQQLKPDRIDLEIYAKIPKDYAVQDLMNLFKTNPHMKFIEM